MLDSETASNAPAVAESMAIPVKQKNSHVNRLLPAFFGGILRVGLVLLLTLRTAPVCPVVLRLATFFPWGGCLAGCFADIGPFLTVLTQFPHHTMTQATNFTDQILESQITESQITEANLKLLHSNSIFSTCLQKYSFFSACFPCQMLYLAIGSVSVSGGITVDVLNGVID